MRKMTNFSVLQGSTLYEIRSICPREGARVLIFYTSTGTFWMGHHPDCCESVTIEEVHGDPGGLKNSHVTIAYESVSKNELGAPDTGESQTWTFYRMQTTKGDLVIRWMGESNGYYSESVDFEEMIDEKILDFPWNVKHE